MPYIIRCNNNNEMDENILENKEFEDEQGQFDIQWKLSIFGLSMFLKFNCRNVERILWWNT